MINDWCFRPRFGTVRLYWAGDALHDDMIGFQYKGTYGTPLNTWGWNQPCRFGQYSLTPWTILVSPWIIRKQSGTPIYPYWSLYPLTYPYVPMYISFPILYILTYLIYPYLSYISLPILYILTHLIYPYLSYISLPIFISPYLSCISLPIFISPYLSL